MCESLNSNSSLDRPSFSNFKHSKPSEQYTYIWTYSVCACTHMHLLTYIFAHTSVQFSHSVVSDSLQPHGPQHARPPCPSPTPRVYRNSSPVSWWCHPTIPSSVVPFSYCIQSFPESGSFQMNWFFTSGGQSVGFSFNIGPSNGYSALISLRMDWLDLLSVKGTLKSFLQQSSKASIIWCSAFFIVQL